MEGVKMRQMWSKSVAGTSFFINHPLFSGSLVMILGMNFANFVSYLYHLVFGRLLGPALYGELAVILSIIGIVLGTFSFLSFVVVKFVSLGDKSKLLGVYFVLRRIIGVILGVSLLLVVATLPISNFLHLNPLIVLLLAPIIFFSFLQLVYGSSLQGLLRFKESAFINILGMLLRLILGLSLFYLGLSLFGVTLGILVAVVISALVAKNFIGDMEASKKEGQKLFKEMLHYSWPAFITSLFITSFITSDIILVRHFFNAETAGIYASLSTLGKIIIYGAAPVSMVMFPMTSRKSSEKQSTKDLLLLSIFLTTLISLGILVIYWAVPELVIKILYGPKYLAGGSYLVWFGVFSAIFSLDYLLANYYLSKNSLIPSYFTAFAALVQIVGIYFWHQNLSWVLGVNIFSALLLFFLLFVYGVYQKAV